MSPLSENNFTSAANGHLTDTVTPLILAAALGLFIIVTIIGNLFVMIAILAEKHLKRTSSALIFSLAVADLMVACLVMPLGAVYEVAREWTFGLILCEIWTSCDVMCCTASILHLLAIAMDRYWSVTQIDYARKRSGKRLAGVICLIWTCSLAVSCAPFFGWKDQGFLVRIHLKKQCLVSQDVAYQVFATCSTFYMPLVFILFLYWRIFQEARKRIRHKPGNSNAVLLVQEPSSQASTNTQESTGKGENGPMTDGTAHPTTSRLLLLARREKSRESLEAKRERKAAKTLAIITGVFVVCWLPFFISALVQATCSSDCLPPSSPLLSVFLWLGYANSLLNPLIYTIFSPDFRNAFRKILCGVRTDTKR